MNASFDSFPRSVLPRIVAGFLAVSITGTLVAANAGPADDSGLVVQVEVWAAHPRNADLDYAFVGVESLSGGGRVRTLEPDGGTSGMFYAGWRLGSAPGTELGVRLWEYDEKTGDATGLDPLNVGPLLSSPDFLLQVVDSAVARTRIRATLIDGGVRWSHELGELTRIDFEAGLRMFRFEEDLDVAYRLEFGQTIDELVSSTTDTRGVGPRIGMSYMRKAGGRFKVGGSLGLALPVGEIEARTLDELVVDGSSQNATEVERDGTSRAFVQLDGEIRCEVRLGAGWSVTAGYAFRHWSGVRSRLRFVDEVSQNAVVPDEDDVVFEGFVGGVSYRF